jgi:O-antigen/teichoic acid export membrane protein
MVGAVPFLFNFLVAKNFGDEILGSVNISLSFCLIITTFITNFFGSSGNKFLAEYRGSKNLNKFNHVLKLIFFGTLITLLIASIIIYYCWSLIFTFFSLPDKMMLPILAYIFVRTFYIIFRRIFYGTDLIKRYLIIEIISGLLMMFSVSYVCINKLDSFLIETFIVYYTLFIILCIITYSYSYKKIKTNLSKDSKFNKNSTSSSFFKYGLTSMIGTVASTGTGYLSVIITGIYLSNSETGIYSSILSIVSILMFIPKLFTQVFLPEFSKLFGQNNYNEILKILKRSVSLLVLLSSTICIAIFIFSDNILGMFGANFISGSNALRILIPSVFIRMMSIPFVAFLSGTKFVIYPNIGGIIILFISIITWIFLVPMLGLLGVALGYTVGIIIGIGYQIIIAIIKIDEYRLNT